MKTILLSLLLASAPALAESDPHVLIPQVAERTALEHSREIQDSNLRHERVVQALTRELFAVWGLPSRADTSRWRSEIERHVDNRRREVEGGNRALTEVKNLVEKAKWLQGAPGNLSALRQRRQCFTQSARALLPCLNEEVRLSNDLIWINQRSIEMNQGRHCRFMNGFCERTNEFSRQIIARETARIQDLQARIAIVQGGGDDPKKADEVNRLEGRIAEYSRNVQEAVSQARDLQRRVVQLARDEGQGGVRELAQCSLSESNPCLREAEEAERAITRGAGFDALVLKLLKPAAEALVSAVERGSNPGGPVGNVRIGANGVLELLAQGEWRGVCDDSFDANDAAVACRMMGKQLVGYSSQRSGNGRFWLDDLSCGGSESSLFDCGSRGLGSHDCGSGEHVAVECR
jgi:hypothetical protein